MSALEHSIHINAGYDYRDDPIDTRGAHGTELVLVTKGSLGAVTAVISTGWMLRPLTGRYVRGRGKQDRRTKPGVDATVTDIYPSGAFVESHAPTLIREYLHRYDNCEYIEGGCYSDIGYTIADSILEALVMRGSEFAFERLDEIYAEWLTPESVEASRP